MESDGLYFRRRAEEEFAMAESASSTDARASHFELGKRYSQLAEAIEQSTAGLGPLPTFQ